ncbi:MAG: Lipopolysaccharide core biosynthesis protein RfaG [Euryarchaeota archaeon UBA443]|jgi:glycosyltransferase involved in cell wall biosynthesis|nr:hypothetical protein [Euryarchaeota archaeon]CAI8272070.1 MAG: Lipopolysaccharide core biosynthesis protein RfaG [Euryarchaeota archaeon UBA443]|tara:strand:- start:5717 stop:7054 length:1338 start_codon:yes stop_codon:yes gene_type:complete
MSKPRLVILHRNMALLGGAQRDLIVALPEHAKRWSITVATLNAPQLLLERCEQLDIDVIVPDIPWQQPSGPLAEMTAKAGRTALKAWRGLRTKLQPALDVADACCIVLGTGGLEVLDIIPNNRPLYVFIHERNKGIYDDVLQRDMDGKLRNSIFVKNLALTYLRRWDQRWHKRLWKRPKTAVSANTPTSSRMLASSYGWPTSKKWIAGDVNFRDEQLRPAEVGVLWPAIDPSAWPAEENDEERNVWDSFAHKPNGSYLLTIGRACFMKGSKEAVQIAAASSLPLVHVGGGGTEEMQRQAEKYGAELVIMPRIDEMEIVALMRNAHALIATARTEGFGLTPMEAAMVGTPALVVNDCGFTHTVTDGFNGRRLPWPNTEEGLEQWVKAVEQAGEETNRKAWSKAGRERILERFSAAHQAEGLARSLTSMGVDVETTDLEMLPGLDPA